MIFMFFLSVRARVPGERLRARRPSDVGAM